MRDDFTSSSEPSAAAASGEGPELVGSDLPPNPFLVLGVSALIFGLGALVATKSRGSGQMIMSFAAPVLDVTRKGMGYV